MSLKSTWGTALVLALATAVATPAIARDDRHDRRGSYSHSRDHDRGRHDRHRDYARDDRHRDHRRDDRRGRDHAYHQRPPVRVVHQYPVVRHVYRPAPRHVGPPPWARGRYVHHYARPVYVVRNYHGYGLRHPPRGYHWVRDDVGDFLMVAIATGVIADIILRH